MMKNNLPPALRMAKAAQMYDMCNCAVYFLNTVAVGMLDVYVGKMGSVVERHELQKFPNIAQSVARLQELCRRMTSTLYDKTSRNLRVATHRWMRQWQEDYIKESRLCPQMVQLVKKRCCYHMDLLEQKALTVAMNQEKNLSNELVQLSMLAASWAEMARFATEDIMKMWRKVIGVHYVTDSQAMNWIQQHKGLNKVAEQLTRSLCHLQHDTERIWWKQYHEEETETFNLLISLIKNERFGDMVTEHMTRDWLDYYIGRAVIWAQQNEGKLHDAVRAEVSELGRWKHDRLTEKSSVMVRTVASQMEKTEDPWDVVDWLAEHEWSVVERLKATAVERMNAKE